MQALKVPLTQTTTHKHTNNDIYMKRVIKDENKEISLISSNKVVTVLEYKRQTTIGFFFQDKL